uniref:CSD domain-containing protein n=1 Tax=Trichobilharzia regenti TaxID=157069 RepID=A0AA85IYU2_TRIRE|nr:unnamed protein product [Trichobilharzia regenti]
MFRSGYSGTRERVSRYWEPSTPSRQPTPLPPPPPPPPGPPPARIPQEYYPYIGPGKWNRGRIRWFNPIEHYGSIIADFRNLEVFFHQSNLYGISSEQLYPDLPVWFQIRPGVRGLEGYNIQPAIEMGGEIARIRRLPERRRTRRFRCYNCGQYASHKAATCPYEPMRRRCYRCRDPTHLIAQCPLLHPPPLFHRYSFPGPSTLQQPQQQQPQPLLPEPPSVVEPPEITAQQPQMQYFFPPGFGYDDDDDDPGDQSGDF